MTPEASAPSPWVVRWLAGLGDGARVLDLACGSGRHARYAAARGLQVTAVDRDAEALAGVREDHPTIDVIEADLEAAPWPLAGRVFDAVIVANYLHRPLFPAIVAAVAPEGLLVVETFASGQARYGRPRREDFLLRPMELVEASHGLRVLAYEDGVERDGASTTRRSRIAACRLGPDPHATLERHRL